MWGRNATARGPHVIPSRADGEGPPSRRARYSRGDKVTSEDDAQRIAEAVDPFVRSLAACAARDDSTRAAGFTGTKKTANSNSGVCGFLLSRCTIILL